MPKETEQPQLTTTGESSENLQTTPLEEKPVPPIPKAFDTPSRPTERGVGLPPPPLDPNSAYSAIKNTTLAAATEQALRLSVVPTSEETNTSTIPDQEPDEDKTNPNFNISMLLDMEKARKAALEAGKNSTPTENYPEPPAPPSQPAPAIIPPNNVFSGAFTSESNPKHGLPIISPVNSNPDNEPVIPASSFPSNFLPRQTSAQIPYYPSAARTEIAVQIGQASTNPIAPEVAPFTTSFWQDKGEKPLYGANGPGTLAVIPNKSSTALTTTKENRNILVKDRDPETTKITTRTARTIEKTKQSTRNKIYIGLGALAISALGLIGIVTTNKNVNSANSTASASASNSPKPPSSAKTLESPVAKTPEKVEATPEFQHGIYKVDMHHPEFLNLLSYLNKVLPGAVTATLDAANQVSIPFLQNPAEIAKAKKDKTAFLTGQESDEDQRKVVFAEFQRLLQDKNILAHQWLRNEFFKPQLKVFTEFQKSGNWPVNSADAQKFFKAFQAPTQLLAEPGIVGYAPETDSTKNLALVKMKKTAPTFHTVFLKASTDLAAEKDPQKMVEFNEFNLIKDNICKRILLIANDPKQSSDFQSGNRYMHSSWCGATSLKGPQNYLNEAVKFTVGIKGNILIKPTPTSKPSPTIDTKSTPKDQIHNNIIQQQKIFNIPLDTPKSPSEKTVPLVKKPTLFGKLTDKVKTFFTSVKNSVKPNTEELYANMSAEEFNNSKASKADLPMYTWKETLRGFLGV